MKIWSDEIQDAILENGKLLGFMEQLGFYGGLQGEEKQSGRVSKEKCIDYFGRDLWHLQSMMLMAIKCLFTNDEIFEQNGEKCRCCKHSYKAQLNRAYEGLWF